jgi:flagellar biosynthesis anti-sigma factor FlgM
MKIQAARAEELTATSQSHATDRPRTNGAEPAAGTAAQVTDRFEVSSDARLADYAIKAAHAAPEIRQDVVEAAKAKLASGKLGADVDHLAGRLIDAMLGG